ncbi:MAG: hypothetical protein ACAI35_15405 [Candidatus Methylacidiphilales bacterium]|nr:hypothetical protein [Candidatus Methylacidiphilales bacterium]
MKESQKEYLLILAHLFLEHEHFEKSRTILVALRELFPADASVARALAYVYHQLGYQDEALAEAEASLEMDLPDDSPRSLAVANTGRLLRSKALWAMGREDEARDALSEYFAMQQPRLPQPSAPLPSGTNAASPF